MKRNILNKAVSILLCIACLMVTIPSSVFADDMSTDVAMGDYYIGNTASNIINGGTIAFYGDVTYFSNELMNGSLCYQKNSSDDINVISEDKVENINISSDGYTIYYSTNGREIKSVNANEPASVVFQSEDEIAQMYLVNDTLLYYLSAGYIHCYDIGAQEDTVIYDKMKLCGFIPNAYGIILITGEMFNYTLYANEKVLADNVLTYRTEDEKLIFDKGENTYQISLKDAFQNELSDDKIDLYQLEDDDVYLFSDFDDENVEDNIDEATVIDQDLELGYDAGDISYPVELFASSGVQNVIKRARQQTEIKWTPKKNVKGYSSNTSGAPTTFKSGTQYKGIPYGQLVNAGKYVPHSYSLNKFISAVNNKDSKFYTSRGKYSVGSKDSPYYASDCSAFVSWSYGLGRMTTTSIGNSSKIKKVSSQSIYSAKVGDCLNKSGSHVVLISDLIYNSGKLSKVTIMEQTPPKAKKTTYSASTITTKYLNKGYVLRRYADIDKVKYEHSCAVPLDGDYCSSCNPVPSKPTITNCNATGATSIKLEWGKVSGASKYKIVRHEVDGANKKTLTENCTSTSYTDKGLISGHTYYYIVYAGNSSNKWSSASTEWKTYTAPATPKQPEVNRDVPKQLTITWNKVDGATKYKLEYHRADTSGWTTLDSNIKTTSYTHKNLADGTKYNYRVTAIREGNIGRADKKKNQKVESGASPTKTKFTQMARPSNSANNDNTSQVVLKWNAVKGSKGYSYAYNVYRDGAKINSSLVTGTTYTDNKAVSGKIHKYQIEIMEKSDTSKTYIGRGKTALYAGSKITKEISVVPQSSTEMKISWAAPASAPSGTKYTIQKYDFTKNEYFKYAETNNTYFVDKNLKAGETYRYYIQVRDKDGNYLTSTFGTAAKLDIAVSKITLNKSEVSLNEGETVNLTATITPENCFDKTVRWASLNEGVASVDANGLVTAKTAGTAEITATTSNNQTAKCVVTVNSKECTHEYEGENEGWIIDTAATCEEAGSRHRVCKKCSETETETIAATGHQYSEEYQTVKEATCTEAGEQAHVCSVCNAQIDNIPIEATGHKFGDTWLVEKGATCDEQGIEYRQCSVCGEKETRDIDSTTHDYELTEKTDVTPDGPGHITYTCKICGESYTEEYVPEINEGTISIGEGSLKAGGTITLPVTIENNPGIAGFNFTLDYDKSVMTPTAITKGGLIPEGTTFTSNLEQGIPASELKEVSVYWGASSNVTEDGELFNITFDVTGGTTDGLYPISLKYEKGDITDAAFNDVMPTIIDNVVTIADVMRGDVNLDRRVDSQDELLLSRYIAKWNLEFNDNQKKAANVFADSAGKINSKDGVRLSQILSGYELIDSGEAASLMASKEVDISLGEAEVTAGDYISVPVTITGNEGIAGFNFTLNYDKEYLTPVAIEKGEMLVDGNFTSNLTEETDGSSLDYVTAYWNCAYDMDEDGELFLVDFVINDNAIPGQQLPIEISCEDGSLCDYALNDVTATLTQGKIDVAEDIIEPDVDVQFNYYIGDIEMKSSDENIYDEIPQNGNFELDINFSTVAYESASEILPAIIYVGVYDENDCLIALKSEEVTEDTLNVESCRIHVDETTNSISKIRAFIWDSLDGLRPLSEVFELSNSNEMS